MSFKDKMDRVKKAITGESAEDDNTNIVAQVWHFEDPPIVTDNSDSKGKDFYSTVIICRT